MFSLLIGNIYSSDGFNLKAPFGINVDRVIKIEPIEKTTYGYIKLMEIYAKQFVVDLHTVDGQTEKSRLK